MRYLPHTSEEITQMLRWVEMDSLDDLFSTVPDECRRESHLDLPDPMSEWELNSHMDSLADALLMTTRITRRKKVAVQSPNFFGCVEDLKDIGSCAQSLSVRIMYPIQQRN